MTALMKNQTGALADRSCDPITLDWEQHSYKTTEHGKPAKNGYEHRPAARPNMVGAHDGEASDEQEDA